MCRVRRSCCWHDHSCIRVRPASAPPACSRRSRDPYLVGPGRAYVGLHFAEEGLRQHLQQRSYLTAAQVGVGAGAAAGC